MKFTDKLYAKINGIPWSIQSDITMKLVAAEKKYKKMSGTTHTQTIGDIFNGLLTEDEKEYLKISETR